MDNLNQQIHIEQRIVELFYSRLDELREQNAAELSRVRKFQPGRTPQGLSERDAFTKYHEDTAARLQAVEHKLIFGRLELLEPKPDDTPGAPAQLQRLHIGRMGMTLPQESHRLVDWRAPVASKFYQTTAGKPENVVRKRHIKVQDRRVLHLSDEVFDNEALQLAPADDRSVLGQQNPLLQALDTARSDKMTDIVATIQDEQDAVIRHELRQPLILQGGPGTGKTVVSLHRAAYLLYTHRDLLSRRGLLIVGPGKLFLSYIDQVLPALGETGVKLADLTQFVPEVSVSGLEEPGVAELKGSTVMAQVIRNAVRLRQRRPQADTSLRLHGATVPLRVSDILSAQRYARGHTEQYHRGRDVFVQRIVTQLSRRYQQLLPKQDTSTRSELEQELLQHRELVILLNLCWMPLTPQRFISELLSKPEFLAQAAAGLLDEKQQRALLRAADADWTTADIALLDEARSLLGPIVAESGDSGLDAAEQEYLDHVLENTQTQGWFSPQQYRAMRSETSGPASRNFGTFDSDEVFGHIIVDEAQELSAMQWRMIMRRCPSRSFTIVGDINQRSAVPRARSWSEIIPKQIWQAAEYTELSVNYRTPAEIMNYAQDLAATHGLQVTPVSSLRSRPESLRVERLTSISSALSEGLQAASQYLDSLPGYGQGMGTIGVIVADLQQLQLTEETGVESRAITYLTAGTAKGLEFDATVVLEPERIVEQASVNDLFVALSRATQFMIVSTKNSMFLNSVHHSGH